MKKPSESNKTFESLLGLGEQSVRKSYYPELAQKLDELEAERNRYKKLNEELEVRVEQRTQALAAVNKRLWEEVKERGKAQGELEKAKEEAEMANKSKDRYLAAASHDLLQPMNAARLLVSTLRERQLPQDDLHMVERVHIALEGAEELLTDLVDIAKLDQNTVQADITEFHLSQLFNSLRTEFQPVADRSGLELRIRATEFVVKSDARLLMRILRNFVSNALRYTNSGGVLVGFRQRKNKLLLEVWDTGEGIPSDRLNDIFKEFKQLDQHRNGLRTGVGLGLAIVDRIAGVIGAEIDVRSRLDRGSVFSICVPLAEQPRRQPCAVLTTATSQAFSGETVLVVDNDQNILISMRALLQQWGLNVLIATDANTAISLCESQALTPETILLDYHLDFDQTGLDALDQLEEHFMNRIPTAMLTAERADNSLRAFKDLGLPVLHKPIKPGKLRALLTHLLNQSA